MIWLFLRKFGPWIAVALVAAAAFGFTYAKGHKSGLAKGRAELEAFRLEVGARILEANARADQAAADFEEWKRTQKPKIVTIVREVDRVLQTPEVRAWSDERVPDQLRESLAAAARDIGASEPLGAVRPVSGLDSIDQCRACQGLPVSPDMGSGVQAEAQTTE